MVKKLLPSLFRVLAFVFIFLISFTTIYTAALFTPGIEGGDSGQTCPSAFSNPKPIVSKTADADLKYMDDRSESNLKVVDKYDLKSVSDPAVKTVLLKKILLEFAKQELDRRQDKTIIRTGEESLLQICAYDRSSYDAKTQKDNFKKQFKGTLSKEDIALNLSNYDDQRMAFFRFLTLGNILILWVMVFAYGIGLFFFRKRLGEIKRVKKKLRIILLMVFVLVLASLVVAPLMSIDSYSDSGGKKCQILDGFDSPKQLGAFDVPGSFAEASMFTEITKSTDQSIEDLEKIKKIRLTDVQIAQFTKDNETIRDEAIKIEAKLQKTPSYKNQVANSLLADSQCVREARLRYLISGFAVLGLVFFGVFFKGMKPRKSEPQNLEISEVIEQ